MTAAPSRFRYSFATGGEDLASPTRPAGKHPTLRPATSTSPPASTRKAMESSGGLLLPQSSKSTANKRSKARSSPSHQMTTRAKSKAFKMMTLPPEIRNNIFRIAFDNGAADPIDISTLKLPALLEVSRQIRQEALPVFFATARFTSTVRSNWCVRNQHLHGPGYSHYFGSGRIHLAPVLLPELRGDAETSVPQEAIRFRDVRFVVKCACCYHAVVLGTVRLSFDGQTPVVELTAKTPVSTVGNTAEILEIMRCAVEREVKRHANAQGGYFGGFSVPLLRAAGDCFRI